MEEEAERRKSLKEKFAYFQTEVKKSVLVDVQRLTVELNEELDARPQLRDMHDYEVPAAVAEATRLVEVRRR